MTMFLLIFVCLSLVAANAEHLSSQPWTNYFDNFAAKIHDYQSDEPAHDKNPFDEGFLRLTNNREKSSQTNTTLTTTCHTVTSTITTEETSSNERLRRSLNEDDGDLRRLLNIDADGDDGKLLEALLKAGPTVDGSGFTEETTTTTTTTTTTAPIPELTGLTGISEFSLSLSPTNGRQIWEQFLAQLGSTSYGPTNLEEVQNSLEQCIASATPCNIPLRFNTSDDIPTLNQLVQALDNIAKELNTSLSTVNRCGNNQTVVVTNVNSCYLINLCRLCGTNPQRGVCVPEKNVSRCECFANSGDPLEPYAGDLCQKTKGNPVAVTPSWTPIVVGVVSGVAGLFLAVTGFLLFASLWNAGILPQPSNPIVRSIWRLPRANLPEPVTSENPEPDPNDSLSESNLDSTLSNVDPAFFQDLDDQLNANYDPIHELDTIIDNEDISSLFHDASDDLPSNSEPFDVINPHVRL